MVWRCACGFWVILLLFFYQLFPLFRFSFFQVRLVLELISCGRNSSKLFHWSFRNYAYFFVMVWRCTCGFGVILPLSFFSFLLSFFNLWHDDMGETLHVFLSWSEDVHVLLGSHHFLSTFYHFCDVFQIPISIRIDTLRVQLILQFSTHHFKLCILVLHGLKCACGFGVMLPLFFFINFFHFFDLVFSRSSYYWNRYLVGATPPRIFYQSFWNYAYLFYMVWRCACGFGVILLSYRFKSHSPLMTKPWRHGTPARNGLL